MRPTPDSLSPKFVELVKTSRFSSLPDLQKTKFKNGSSSQAAATGMTDLEIIHHLGKPIPDSIYSLRKKKFPRKNSTQKNELVESIISSEDRLAITKERCRHLLHYCSHPTPSCRDMAAQYLWKFSASQSLHDFSRKLLDTALSPPQPSLYHLRCYVQLFGISEERLEKIHSFRDKYLGEKLVDWLIPQASTTRSLPPALQTILREIVCNYPFPVKRKVANEDSLNWRVFSQLLSRGLPLHSLEAIAVTDYQTFLKAASSSEKSETQIFLRRIARLSPDLERRVLNLVGTHSLLD